MDSCTAYIIGWVWGLTFGWMITTLKFMAMDVVAVFVGPVKTLNRMAVSNTERRTRMPYDVTPDVFNVERIKVTFWMIWAFIVWAAVLGLVLMQVYM